MFTSHINFKNVDLVVVKALLPHLQEKIFYGWYFPPKIEIKPCDEEEFELHITYENTAVDESLECIDGHLAIDITQAFIEGALTWNEVTAFPPATT